MHRRQRLIAGIFALVAMVLSSVGTVWASTCGPMMEMGAPAHEVVHEMPSAMDDMTGPAEGEGRSGGDGERPCPFGPAATIQGCVAAVSLPAHPVAAPAPALECAVTAPSVDLQHDLLIETTLFRPPRA